MAIRGGFWVKRVSTLLITLLATTAGESEVVVINVMGDIEPAHFKDVMVALNVKDAPEVQVASVN